MIIDTTVSVFPGIKLEVDVDSGWFTPAREKEFLEEEEGLLEHLEQPETYFRAAHALDSVCFAWTLTKETVKR